MNIVKKTLIIVSLFIYNSSFSQDQITVSINKKNSFIEFHTDHEGYYYTKEAVRLGPSSSTSLRSGIEKAIKWANINTSQQLSFTKEIARFKVISKTHFDLIGYYKPDLAFDLIIKFHGYDDGSFTLQITKPSPIGSDEVVFTIETISDLIDIKELLKGNQINNQVNQLFN